MIARLLPLVLVLTFASVARADDKPKIAVLGVEVSGTIDTEATTLARNLTIELRAKAKASPKYVVAPNSQKDLFDEKLANNCETEAAACMAVIAKKYGAAWLVYATIVKKTKDGNAGYQFSVRMLDVERKTAIPWTDFVPLADTNGSAELGAWATKAWNGVTGEDEPKVVVPPPLKHEDPKPGGGWRATAYIAGGGTVLLGGAFVYSWRKLAGLDFGKKCDEQTSGPIRGPEGCGYGGKLKATTYIAGIGAGVVGGIAIYAVYKGFVSSKEHAGETSLGKSQRKRESRLVVTPVVSPDGAGATVRFDW